MKGTKVSINGVYTHRSSIGFAVEVFRRHDHGESERIKTGRERDSLFLQNYRQLTEVEDGKKCSVGVFTL